MNSVRRALATVVVAIGLLLSGASVAAAQGGGSEAYLRLAHLSPDTPNVDVYVASVADPTRSFVVPGVGYGAVSPYQSLPAGSYVISMRGAGAPADSPAVISASVDARPGAAYTIAGVGMSKELGLSVLDDRLETPPSGKASVRVINAAVSRPQVDIGPANRPNWATGVKFGTDTPYADVPLGTWNLQVSAPGQPAVSLPCELDANSVYTVLLVDKDGALKAQLLQDSAGSKVVPNGAINAGYGGTAADGSAALNPVAAFAGGLIVVIVGGLLAAWSVAGGARGR
jgi:hypothetical protein